MTLFYHVHDGDFEIRPNEPKLIIGVDVLKKKHKTREKYSFSTIREALDYVIITHLLSCKICMVLQDSCKTGIGLQEACKNTMFCKKLARFQFFPNLGYKKLRGLRNNYLTNLTRHHQKSAIKNLSSCEFYCVEPGPEALCVKSSGCGAAGVTHSSSSSDSGCYQGAASSSHRTQHHSHGRDTTPAEKLIDQIVRSQSYRMNDQRSEGMMTYTQHALQHNL